MVCRTDNVSGIAGAVTERKAEIKKEEAQKVEQSVVCNSAFAEYEDCYGYYVTAGNKAHLSNMTKKQMEKKLELLKVEMKIKIAEASKNGKSSAEIAALRIYYEDLIGDLEGAIEIFDKQNKAANTESANAETAKQAAKFSWISETGWFQQICQTLFGDYLSLGNMERAAYIEQLEIQKQSAVPDDATKSFWG